MQKRKFRILSAATAGSLALAAVAITASSGTHPAAKHVALAPQAESSPSVNLDNCPTLHTGYPAGGCVAQLQTDLNAVQGNHLVVDGIFGPVGSQTYKAVIAFQQAHGLPQDGLAGPDTKKALEAAISGDSVSTPAVPTPTLSPATAASVVTSPSFTSVEYIEGFSLTGCVTDLVQHGVIGLVPPPAPPAPGLLCGALHQSQNSAPPNHLDQSNIAGFAATKEYRGLMMVPPYKLSCSSAGQVLSVSAAGDSPFYASLGYTKVPIAGIEFHPGESYNSQDPTFDTGVPTIVTDPDSAVTISYRWASRIATTERDTQYYISHYDAPFIWLTFDEKISCDGQQAARFNYTNFPSTDIYINGSEVSHDKESNSFAHFIKQGGTKLNAAGHGNLAFPCLVKQFDNGNPSPVVSYSACQNNQLPPGAGTGGGGNL